MTRASFATGEIKTSHEIIVRMFNLRLTQFEARGNDLADSGRNMEAEQIREIQSVRKIRQMREIKQR